MILNAPHIASLISSLKYEATKEIHLLEQFTKMLISLHPQFEKPFESSLKIFDACTSLLEKQTYPASMIEMLSLYAMSSLLQVCNKATYV